MHAKHFIELVKRCDFRGPYSYSGRAMYGRRCVAVNFNNDGELAVLAAKLAMEAESENEGDGDEIVRLMSGTRTDSMGLSIVAYWPAIEWPKGEEG